MAGDLPTFPMSNSFISSWAEKNFLVAVSPSEPCKVVHDGLGQKAVLPVFEKRAAPCRLQPEAGLVSLDQGHVAEPGRLKAEGPVHEYLAGRIVDVVVAPDDVGKAHEGVVDYDREIVGRRVVAPEYDEVIQLLGLKRIWPLHHVVKGDGACQGRLEPDDEGPVRPFLGALPACPVVGRFSPSAMAFFLFSSSTSWVQ